MIKHYLLFLSGLLFLSCAGNYIKAVPDADFLIDDTVSQETVVDTSFDNSKLYQQFQEMRTDGPVVPGLKQALVPQGMAYLAVENALIISNYMSDESAGALSFINMDDGKLSRVILLYEKNKTPHTGHLGGLAVSSDYLWIASGAGVYYLSLDLLAAAPDGGTVYLSDLIETETKGSFAAFSNDVLWIGEFTRKNGSYPTSETHHIQARDNNSHRGWLGGYKLSTLNTLIDYNEDISAKLAPDYIISIPHEVQGAAFFDGKVLLSTSYGRKNYSRLKLYNSPLTEPPLVTKDFSAAENIPLWFLDDKNKVDEIIVPPMSEAVTVCGSNIAVLFESAASKYRDTASFPVDKIQLIAIDEFER